MEGISVSDATDTSPPWLTLLDRRLRILSAGIDADWAVYAHFLATGDEIAINADRLQDTMSLIKVPVLLALMRAVDAGRADLGTRIELTDDDKRLGTGVLGLFDAGARLTLRDAAWLMIVVSDNTATDLCLRAIGGPSAVNDAMAEIGIDGISMTGDALSWFRALAGSMDPALSDVPAGELARRGYPAMTAFERIDARAKFHAEHASPFSLASARALGSVLTAIHKGTCASPDACALMRQMLQGQQLQTMSPRYIWPTVAAHKTGNFYPHISSDIGIYEPVIGSPFILCILTQQYFGEREMMEDTIARMSELATHAAESLVSAEHHRGLASA